MNKWYWIVIPLSLSLVNCKSSSSIPVSATNCAAVVQNYLGLTDTVAVTNYIEPPSMQQVNIEYQSQNDENIPVEGTASCVFSSSDSDTREYLNAVTINNQPLTKADVTALNQQVKFSQ
jgi:lipocalin